MTRDQGRRARKTGGAEVTPANRAAVRNRDTPGTANLITDAAPTDELGHHRASLVTMNEDPAILLTPRGQELLARLAAERDGGSLAVAERLRREYPADLVATAMAQRELRLAAEAKFSRAAQMLFTRAGVRAVLVGGDRRVPGRPAQPREPREPRRGPVLRHRRRPDRPGGGE